MNSKPFLLPETALTLHPGFLVSELDLYFLSPELNPYTLDIYASRHAIASGLRAALPQFSGTVLDIGCGQQPYRSWLLKTPSLATRYIGVDLPGGYNGTQPDVTWNGLTVPLADGAANSVLLTEVLEHCPDPGAVLDEIFRLLAPGGFLFLTVPFLWPLHDNPYDEFRYTPFSLARIAAKSGFVETEVLPLGGWDASLAQMIGLWVRRRPMPEFRRRVLQRLLFPLYRRLLRADQPPANWDKSVMITGLSMSARKPVSPSGAADTAR